MFNIVVPLFHSVTVDSRSRGSRPGAGAPAPPAPRRAGHGHGGVTAVRRARGARRRCGGVLSARRASVACTVRTRTRRAARAPRPARGATAPVGAQWPRAGPAARERHMQRPHTHTHTHTCLAPRGTYPAAGLHRTRVPGQHSYNPTQDSQDDYVECLL